jgi:hypothetical protein
MKFDEPVESFGESLIDVAGRLIEQVIRLHRALPVAPRDEIRLDAVATEDARHAAARAQDVHRSARAVVL